MDENRKFLESRRLYSNCPEVAKRDKEKSMSLAPCAYAMDFINMPKEHKAALLWTLKPSKRLKKMLIFVHALAIAASMANALALSIKVGLFALIGAHGWWAVRRLNIGPHAIKYTEAFGWELSEGSDFTSIEILKSTVVTTHTLILHFTRRSHVQTWKSGHKKTLLVLSDALAEEDYRCLIVKLKTAAIK